MCRSTRVSHHHSSNVGGTGIASELHRECLAVADHVGNICPRRSGAKDVVRLEKLNSELSIIVRGDVEVSQMV